MGTNPVPSPASVSESPFKGKTGWRRLRNALGYSLDGLRAAFRHESAFRLECTTAAILIPVGLWWGDGPLAKALLCSSVLGVLMAELINSAIEAVVDRVSLEVHPLAKRAKDIGSALVLMALINAALVWWLLF
jgi:diacylglycerol kinase (ATP)